MIWPSRCRCSISSFTWRRTLRTATLPSSARSRATLISSLRRSWVRGGKLSRMMVPSLEGLIPSSEALMAFSMGVRALRSYGEMTSWRASGTEMPAIWLRGTLEP